MRRFLIVISTIAVICLPLGCIETKTEHDRDRADLIDYGQGKIDVLITKRTWVGQLGPEGYIGYKNEHYRAGLRGNGPIFVNPIFQDNPPTIRCVGTITLDREQNQIVLNINRIMSKPGELERTKPHPANGVYSIDSKRSAGLNEPSL